MKISALFGMALVSVLCTATQSAWASDFAVPGGNNGRPCDPSPASGFTVPNYTGVCPAANDSNPNSCSLPANTNTQVASDNGGPIGGLPAGQDPWFYLVSGYVNVNNTGTSNATLNVNEYIGNQTSCANLLNNGTNDGGCQLFTQQVTARAGYTEVPFTMEDLGPNGQGHSGSTDFDAFYVVVNPGGNTNLACEFVHYDNWESDKFDSVPTPTPTSTPTP